MDNRQQALNAINTFHHAHIDQRNIDPSQSFKDQAYDSLDFVEVVMHVEKELQISIPDDFLEDGNVMTVEKFLDIVEKLNS